ncbi:MAG: hypothetical protein HY811_12345 [Planctomycetes bacterium]|nr:hypothetical protein [Planctomycetota bacterium]
MKKINNKMMSKGAVKISLLLVSIGILSATALLGSGSSAINQAKHAFDSLAALGWLEKFIIVCVVGWIIFVLNVKRIAAGYFKDIIVKAKAKAGKTAKPVVKGWMANKSQGAPERENRLNISVLGPDGECVARQSSELISLAERTRFAKPTQNIAQESFKVQTAEWVNGESMPVITR